MRSSECPSSIDTSTSSTPTAIDKLAAELSEIMKMHPRQFRIGSIEQPVQDTQDVARMQLKAGSRWVDPDLVFTTYRTYKDGKGRHHAETATVINPYVLLIPALLPLEAMCESLAAGIDVDRRHMRTVAFGGTFVGPRTQHCSRES